MATSIVHSADVLQHVGPSSGPTALDTDAQKLRALVRSNMNNVDRLTLEHVVSSAYRMGNESYHRAMSAASPARKFQTLEEIERCAVETTFSLTHGDARRTAKILGIGKTTLYRKLHDYGIAAPRYEHCPNCGCRLKVPQLQTPEQHPYAEHNEHIV